MKVEIDKSCFSHQKYNVGKCLPTQFGGYCRQTKESFLIAVEDRSAATLLPIVKNDTWHGSKICSDEWKAYQQLIDLGFEHDTQFATSAISTK